MATRNPESDFIIITVGRMKCFGRSLYVNTSCSAKQHARDSSVSGFGIDEVFDLLARLKD